MPRAGSPNCSTGKLREARPVEVLCIRAAKTGFHHQEVFQDARNFSLAQNTRKSVFPFSLQIAEDVPIALEHNVFRHSTREHPNRNLGVKPMET